MNEWLTASGSKCTHVSQFELSHAVASICSMPKELNCTFDVADVQPFASKVTTNRQRVRMFRYMRNAKVELGILTESKCLPAVDLQASKQVLNA